MEPSPSKTIHIALAVIMLCLTYLVFFTGPDFSGTEKRFFRSAEHYQETTGQVARDIARAIQEQNYGDLEMYADQEKAPGDTGYGFSLRLQPYKNEIFQVLADEEASAEALLLAARSHNRGLDSLRDTYLVSAEGKTAEKENHLNQAARILAGLKRPWWYYTTGG